MEGSEGSGKSRDANDGLRDRRHGSRLQAEALSYVSRGGGSRVVTGHNQRVPRCYRQTIASGLKAASNRSYHGGSLRGGYGHGLAADVVSINGGTRDERWASSESFWKWIDVHGKEFGVGRPYLDRDPPHVAPIDGKEYAAHHGGTKTHHAGSDLKKGNRLAARHDRASTKHSKTARSSKIRTI